MSTFANKFPFLAVAFAAAFGEANAAIEYDEENNAATLGSEHLGAINKHVGDVKASLQAANENLEAQATQHTEAVAAKDATIAEQKGSIDALNARISELEGSQPAKPASGAKADSDANGANGDAPKNVSSYLDTVL